MRTLVIAEAAACHDGDFGQAECLVRLASLIGANAIKFQWCSDPEQLAERRQAKDYLRAYRVLAFPYRWHASLQDLAECYGLEYLCTVYLAHDIALIAPYVSRFKIASFEALDTEFVNAHRPYGKPILISAGLGATLTYENIDVLHCVSAYPAPAHEMRLRVIRRFPSRYIGLSDHSRHPWTGALAVAAGASVVEFHMRLEETRPDNADYAVARSPKEAREYVRNIRCAEAMLGDGAQRLSPCEAPMLKYQVHP